MKPISIILGCLISALSLVAVIFIALDTPAQAQEAFVQNTPLTIQPLAQVGGAFQAVAVQDSIAYVGIGPRLVLIDISDPAQPKLISQTAPIFSGIQWIKVMGKYAYLNGGGKDLNVVDISNQTAPTLLGSIDLVGSSEDFVFASAYGYLANGSGGLRIVDISDPANLHEVGLYDTPGQTYGIAITGTTAYVADNSSLRIMNVSNSNNPIEVGNYAVSARKVILAGQHAYVAGAADLNIFTTTVITQPVQAGVCTNCFKSVKNMVYQDNNLYVADGRYGGLRFVDVSDPSTPVLSFIQTEYDTTNVAVSSSVMCIADMEDGLLIYTPIETWWQFAGGYKSLGSLPNMQVDNGFAYAANGLGLRIVNVYTPHVPVPQRLFNFWNVPGFVNLEINGTYAYVNGLNLNLTIMDISNVNDIKKIGQHSEGHFSDNLEVQNNYAYIGAWSTFRVFDVSNPVQPVRVGYLYFQEGGLTDIEVNQDNYAYISFADKIRLLDISAHVTPTVVTTFTVSQVASIDTYGTYAYLVTNNNGMQVRDISDPLAFTLLNTIPLNGTGYRIHIIDRYAFISTSTGTHVFDLLDPVSPQYVAETPLQGVPAMYDHVLYLGAGSDGMYALWFFIPVQASIPIGGGSLVSAMDHTTYTLPANVFTQTVTITHTAIYPGDLLVPQGLKIAGHAFEVQAHSLSGFEVQPSATYQLEITYSDHDVSGLNEDSLALYTWDAEQNLWVKEPTSFVDTTNNRLTASPNHFSKWAIMGSFYQVFLPLVKR